MFRIRRFFFVFFAVPNKLYVFGLDYHTIKYKICCVLFFSSDIQEKFQSGTVLVTLKAFNKIKRTSPARENLSAEFVSYTELIAIKIIYSRNLTSFLFIHENKCK